MYTDINFKSKKQLKEAIATGQYVGVFNPGPFGSPTEGWVALEGPHYPKAHTWYAQGFMEAGKLIKVK